MTFPEAKMFSEQTIFFVVFLVVFLGWVCCFLPLWRLCFPCFIVIRVSSLLPYTWSFTSYISLNSTFLFRSFGEYSVMIREIFIYCFLSILLVWSLFTRVSPVFVIKGLTKFCIFTVSPPCSCACLIKKSCLLMPLLFCWF